MKAIISSISCIILSVFLITTSCSKDDSPETPVTPIVFESLKADKNNAFIEDKIVLEIDGSGFDDVVVSSSKQGVEIDEINKTTYHISSNTQLVNINITVQLIKGDAKKTGNMVLNFYEHGIKDFKIVEGIQIDVDKTDKVLELLGEPEGKRVSNDGDIEFWYYFTKGFYFSINKSTGIVISSIVYGSFPWSRIIDGNEINGSQYAYEIGNSWSLINADLKMDEVVNKLGQPEEKVESTTPGSSRKSYRYNNPDVVFSFFSSHVDDYLGKSVLSIVIY